MGGDTRWTIEGGWLGEGIGDSEGGKRWVESARAKRGK